MFRIGPYCVGSQTVLAPMAGVSDLPFRSLCSAMGAGMVVHEMVTSDTRMWDSPKSQTRLSGGTSNSPKVMQIAGSDPSQMAQAAVACVELGAEIVDINMGCPAKKVCNKAAGSALLKDEKLVQDILEAVVKAVPIPVTLKFRTGWDTSQRNALTVAKIAEQAGVAALTLHGRTRACRFLGQAEYDTIAQVVAAVDIPVIANGDIDTPQKALQVLKHTGAVAVMIGRAAQGNPWLFAQINAFLASGTIKSAPNLHDIRTVILQHITALHQFYGEYLGARIARKHVGWYLAKHFSNQLDASAHAWRKDFQTLTQLEEQSNAVCQHFERLHQLEDQAA